MDHYIRAIPHRPVLAIADLPPTKQTGRPVRPARMGSSYGSSPVFSAAHSTPPAAPRQQQEKTRLQNPPYDRDRHLDLGCGRFPRNPYARGQLCGVDIRPLAEAEGFDYRVANLILEPIPYPDDSFSSVSAFDFI